VVEAIRVLVENDPGVIATEEAFVTFQLKVEVPAENTKVGDAEKNGMAGVNASVLVESVADDAE
jgi:hypothetical protein